MKRALAAVASAALVLVGTPSTGVISAVAGPSQGGISSDNVTYVAFVPFEVGTATGLSTFGKKDAYMVITGWKSFSIYDISNPEAPVRISTTPFGFAFENENVSTDGKIMLFSETTPQSILHIWDIEDKTNPVEIAALAGAGEHTMSCILKCKWGYGSSGGIVDLRDPTNPVKMEENWITITELLGGVHDVEEFKNGQLVTSPLDAPFQWLDVRDPLKPKVKGVGPMEQAEGPDFLFHSGRWPNEGKDKFVLMQGEQNVNPQCNDTTGPFMSFDASKVKKTKTFEHIDTFRVSNGTMTDGSPPANGLGCSAHWFEEHPTFKNGGLVAVGYYEHGTRFIDVDKKGKLTEEGWFLPFGGSTSAAYWINDEIVYAIDYTRGLDILRWTGDL